MENYTDMLEKSYDDIPYYSKVFKITLPENLALAGLIYGIETPDINKAKVLELGCASGVNLISYAQNHKDSKVVGVDLSSTNIKLAKELSDFLGLKNTKFIKENLKNLNLKNEKFDYIIAHGLYSWVDDDTKDAIFDIIDKCLSKNGIAYISFNAYPGWKSQEILRYAMNFRTTLNSTPNDKINLGFDTLAYMKKNAIDPYIKSILDEEYDELTTKNKNYIMHEYFEHFNKPNYLYEVVELARKHNLDYLCDAIYKNSIFAPIDEDTKAALKKECGGDRAKFEQFIDFLTNARFKRSLFIKDKISKNIKDDIDIKFKTIDKLFISGKTVYDNSQKCFKNLNDNTMPKGMCELFDKLNEIYPSNLNIGKFMDEYKKNHSDEEVIEFYNNLGYLLCGSLLEFSLNEYNGLKNIPTHPKVNKFSLKLAEYIKNNENTFIPFFSPKYNNLEINRDLFLEIFLLMDGSNDIEKLVEKTISLQKNGKFNFIIEDKNVTDAKRIEQMSKEYIEKLINDLYNEKFFVE